MAEGVDYSGARPSGLCLVRSGKIFAGRYFGPGGSWKLATRAECAALGSSGVTIVSLVEGYANDANLGYAKGAEHARLGHRGATAAGMPAARPLYFAVDFDATTAQLANVAQYMRGAASVIGQSRVGAYGGYRTIEYLWRRGLIAWAFQTYAWSAGRWSAFSHIEQYRNGVLVCGGRVDLCRSKRADYGGWRPGREYFGPAPGQPPQPPSETPWEFMDLLASLGDRTYDVATRVDAATRSIEDLT